MELTEPGSASFGSLGIISLNPTCGPFPFSQEPAGLGKKKKGLEIKKKNLKKKLQKMGKDTQSCWDALCLPVETRCRPGMNTEMLYYPLYGWMLYYWANVAENRPGICVSCSGINPLGLLAGIEVFTYLPQNNLGSPRLYSRAQSPEQDDGESREIGV